MKRDLNKIFQLEKPWYHPSRLFHWYRIRRAKQEHEKEEQEIQKKLENSWRTISAVKITWIDENKKHIGGHWLYFKKNGLNEKKVVAEKFGYHMNEVQNHNFYAHVVGHWMHGLYSDDDIVKICKKYAS